MAESSGQLPSAKSRLTERNNVFKSEGFNAPKVRAFKASVAPTAALFFLHLLMRKAPRKTVTTPATHDVTELLQDWSEGDESALERLMPLVYDELHRLAHQHMRREKPGQILQTSALINEAYLRLVDRPRIHWENRAQFFGIAARVMRRILVDEARKRKSDKRGGDAIQVTLNDATNMVHEQAANVVALDEALKTLEAIDSRQCKIVELRFFGGLSVEETAQVLKVSPETVMRDWTFARAWLRNEMTAK